MTRCVLVPARPGIRQGEVDHRPQYQCRSEGIIPSERVGSRRVEGMDALRVAEQRERGYASQQPEFILRRPKVVVTE